MDAKGVNSMWFAFTEDGKPIGGVYRHKQDAVSCVLYFTRNGFVTNVTKKLKVTRYKVTAVTDTLAEIRKVD